MPYGYPWGHDRTWEREVVERIRRGGEAPRAVPPDSDPSIYYEAVSFNADGWEFAEEHSKGAIRTHAVYLNDEAIAARQKKRAEQRAAFRELLAKEKAAREAAIEAAKAKREAIEAAKAERRRKAEEEQAKWAAAREAEWKLWTDGRAERIRFAAESMRQWEASASIRQRLAQERSILASKWLCTECNGPSTIKLESDGYRLTCSKCGKSAWGSHESIMKVRAGI